MNCFCKPTAIQSVKSNEPRTIPMYQSSQKPQSNNAKDAARKKGKPFCKVCFDAGKPESEYTSHYLKSSPGPTGKLVCPTLLNQSCLTCGKCGHTSSYCDQAKTKSNERSRLGPITCASIGASIGAEAELKLIASQFPSLEPEQPKAEKQAPNPQQEQDPSPHFCHVYNPKSNPFGALSVKQTHKKTSFQSPTTQQQPTTQQHPTQEKPMTMAERLKNPPPKAPAPKAAKTNVPALTKPKFADMPPKSQFWWQDEDD